MSAALQERLDAVGRLLELSAASESADFQAYADHARAVALERLDVAAGVKRLNKKIVEDYGEAITAVWLTRRACWSARGRE